MRTAIFSRKGPSSNLCFLIEEMDDFNFLSKLVYFEKQFSIDKAYAENERSVTTGENPEESGGSRSCHRHD
jgi:hypothetical protein